MCSTVRNLLNEAELQHVWKGLLSNESVVKRAWDVSIVCIVFDVGSDLITTSLDAKILLQYAVAM